MAGYRYTKEEKRFLIKLVQDKKSSFNALLKEAQEKGDSVLQNLISDQLVVADSAMDKLTGTFCD